MRKVILLALIIAIAIQFVPVKMENPPHIAPSLPEKVLKILKKGCYDCHSNTTRWPWYSRIAPISWLIANDVTEGREELNFSRWNSMNERTKKKKIREIWEEVSEGEMPPLLYSVMHPESDLTNPDRSILHNWAITEGEYGLTFK